MKAFEPIETMIKAGRVAEAFEMLNRCHDHSVWMQNARAVCLMRMGQPAKAVAVLSPLVYKEGSIAFRPNVSETIKLNLVTAMLLRGNVSGAMVIFRETHENSPERKQLQDAVVAWKRRQSFLSRIAFSLGMLPFNRPVALDFPPGQLIHGEQASGLQAG